jgi:hypothetical protein
MPHASLRTPSLLAALCAAAGCAGEPAAPAPEPSPAAAVVEAVRLCTYRDFSVDITAGPHRGLRLAGELTLTRRVGDALLQGTLRTTDRQRVFVTGAYYPSGDVSLTFHTALGYVMGLGRVPTGLCRAGTTVEGIAFGPSEPADHDPAGADTGHWVLGSPLAGQQIGDGTLTVADFNDDLHNVSTAADGFTANAVACVRGATQVSQNCCSNGGSRVTCSAGGATCTRVEPGGGQPAFTCCSGRHQDPRNPNNSLCDGAVSQIQP